MKKFLKTPGVYIEEKNAFPNSVVQVATAIPAFIGYTEKALRDNKQLINRPTRITSLNEYHKFFGFAPKTLFAITPDNITKFKVAVDTATQFNLYRSINLFFANGGNTCYVVSVGDFSNGVNYKDLNDDQEHSGIPSLLKCPEPTMLVIPDAVLLQESDCFELQKVMLEHCGKEMNRVAILDVLNADQPRTYDHNDVVKKSREGLGNSFLEWGAAYYPYLNTTIVQEDDVDFSNVSNTEVLASLLDAEAEELYGDKAQVVKDEVAKLLTDNDPSMLQQTLLTQLPLYKTIMNEIRKILNVLPPSGAIAGIISMVDNSVGVFKSPANVSIGSVKSPTVNITAKDQEDLNNPSDGKAINTIRTFLGKGVLVWGARTLAGNNPEWRYLSVRRTIIMLEQSLKVAAKAYVFEPNDENTWASVKGMITNFLIDQWKMGALAGATPKEAFNVDIGLGKTMTETDILEGIMKITVMVAVIRPAEFIVISIQQHMQKS